MKSLLARIFLLIAVPCGLVQAIDAQTEVQCLPKSSCTVDQPLCTTCLPTDPNCTEPETIIDGFCGPYLHYFSNDLMRRGERYGACKDAALARATPEMRDVLNELQHRFFYKNCIGGEYMCVDGSCQEYPELCDEDDRQGLLYYPAEHEACTDHSKVDDLADKLRSAGNANEGPNVTACSTVCHSMHVEYISHETDSTIRAVASSVDLITGVGEYSNSTVSENLASKLRDNVAKSTKSTTALDVYPKYLKTNNLVRFCTYFYEVVILGGRKQPAATEQYIQFLYHCFTDYQDFGTTVLVNTMNEFFELSGQRAINNLDTFDAANYITPEINPGVRVRQAAGTSLTVASRTAGCPSDFITVLLSATEEQTTTLKRRIKPALTSTLPMVIVDVKHLSLSSLTDVNLSYCTTLNKEEEQQQYRSVKHIRGASEKDHLHSRLMIEFRT